MFLGTEREPRAFSIVPTQLTRYHHQPVLPGTSSLICVSDWPQTHDTLALASLRSKSIDAALTSMVVHHTKFWGSLPVA